MRKNKVKLVSIISLLVCILIFLIKPITVKASSINNYNQEQVELQAKQIVKISNNPEYSGVPLKLNHGYTIKQLYEATLIQSANGPAMLLGQAISGSQQAFVKKMRKQLVSWNIGGGQRSSLQPMDCLITL